MIEVYQNPTARFSFLSGWLAIISLFAALYLLGYQPAEPKTTIVFIPLMLFCLLNLATLPYKWAIVGVAVGIIVTFSYPIIWTISNGAPIWDFHLFWVFGQTSAHGLNPYDQSNLLTMAVPLNLSQEVLVELFFFHPPPTLLFFAPLGWFDFDTAFLIWSIFHSILLVATIVMLWRMFWYDTGFPGLLVVAAIVLMIRSTVLNYSFSQLNFQLLLFILFYWYDRNQARKGLWIALAIFTKPIAVFLLLYPIIKKQWNLIGGMIASMAGISALTIMIYGPQMFFDYFLSNPVSNDMPTYLYTEGVNQSLLATILRLTGQAPSIFNAIFVVSALVLTSITGWLIYRLDDRYRDWLIALNLVLALLIFPKTLTHYTFLLVAPMFVIVKYWQEIPGKIWSSIILFTLIAILISMPSNFRAVALAWGSLAGIGLWYLYWRGIPKPD